MDLSIFVSHLVRDVRRLRQGGIAVGLVIALAICYSTASAQSGAGSIQGSVTDSTGAVMAGASIHVVNQATASSADTKTNGVGFYQVPGLFTGVYDVTITAPAMKTYKTTIELLVDQNAEINASMTAGAVTEQVAVTAQFVQLTTADNGTITSTLENERINQIPMNGRNVMNLIGEATPGLENCMQGAVGTCANGLMGQAMEYVADGVTLSNREFGGEHMGQNQMPDPDSIQEVRVETSGVGAQFATPAAAVITTKSGTNSIHGAFFETARNNGLGIAKARQNPSNFAAPHYVRNEFGASAGGPIVLPFLYHGKDKSFWFFAYERYSLSSAGNELVTVPTTAMRGGDFSGLLNSAGTLQQLYDPATTAASPNCNNTGVANPSCRQPFLNNQIPIARLSPTAKMLLDITPQPDSIANPLVTTNLAAVNPSFTVIPTITFRLDHEFDENDKAYLRYTGNTYSATSLRNQPSNQPASIAADGFPFAASGIGYNPDALFAAALGFTHVFSPTFFSETIVSQQWWSEQNKAGGTPLVDFEQKMGVPNNFGAPGFPNISGIITPFNGTMFIYGLTQIVQNLDENLTKTLGRHQMRFGFRYRHERFGIRPDMNSDTIAFGAFATGLLNPSTISTNAYSATTSTGNANGDMFLGAASSYSSHLEPPYVHAHDMEFDGYVQDDYHISRNLTLNLGLRYEAHPAPWMKNGQMMSFDLKNDAVVLATTPADLISRGLTTQAIITNILNDGGKIETADQAGMPSTTLLKNHDLTLGPRVGLAWQPFGSKFGTVIRGAYGRYIYPVPIRSSMNGIDRNNPFAATYSQSYTTAAQSPDGLPNPLLRTPQSVVMGVNSSGVVNSSTTTAITPGISIYNMDPHYAPDYATQTNLTIEQPFKGNSAMRVSWLYTHGSNLDQEYQYNTAPSNYVWEMQTGTTPPNGGASAIGTNQYSTTGTLPYDKVTWGSGSSYDQTSGWSNYNGLQANYQRLYHRGVSWQVSYTWAKAFRAGGDYASDGMIYPTAIFANSGPSTMSADYGKVTPPNLGPSQPAGTASYAYFHAMNRFQNYIVDTVSPKQHIQFNGVVDLPFGKGKKFLGDSNRFMNEIVGGFQLAGAGSIVSQDFAINATNWGPTNPLKIYKHNAPITDCRGTVCLKEFQWFNGYIAPTVIPSNSSNASCTLASGLVTGLPSDWAPYQSPIDTDCNKSDAAYKYYNVNEVNITLPGKTAAPIAYAPGPATSTSTGGVGENPFAHTILNGPINYTVDLSVFKAFPITEKVNVRFNVDAFNALNVQGYNNPSSVDGTETMTSSHNTARQLQLTLRLQF